VRSLAHVTSPPDEENRLLPQLVGVRAHLLPIVILDINTGLREMELLTLKPEHIDFHRDVIYMKGTKSDEDREVPINGTARELLTELVGVAKQNGHEYLFTNPKTRRHHACIKNAWNTACRKAAISNFAFSRSTPHVRNASSRQRRFDRGGSEGHGSQVD
jgi:integrase